jgi:hypothetical protein
MTDDPIEVIRYLKFVPWLADLSILGRGSTASQRPLHVTFNFFGPLRVYEKDS